MPSKKIASKPSVKKKSKNSVKPPYVIAIGASAGGLEAIQDYFDQMPTNTGAAFVVIQHLSPDFKSLMDQLLARNTDMNIFPVKDGMRVESNTIYLIPPKQNMHIQDGHLRLTEQQRGHSLNLPIDIFFASLAREYTKKAIAIILSGTGSDGSKGIMEVAKAGGLIIVQNPDTSQFDGMPRNAITTKCVDIILDVADMPGTVVKFMKNPSKQHLIQPDTALDPTSPIAKIFSLLKAAHKVDFSLYKTATISRRLERRLQAVELQDLNAYKDLLLHDTQEVDFLYKDLLIGVTSFFRDEAAFDLLKEKVVPQIVEQHHQNNQEIRVWITACSTGEEVYSLGMLFLEYMEEKNLRATLKIFGTDLNKSSIDFASAAIYDERQIEGVSEERLKKFFTVTHDGRYQINSMLRNQVVFSQHNLITNPPLTRMALISCRNFLIYIQPQTQQKILGFLRFSLNVEGYLFLGSSETIADIGIDLCIVNTNWKIFKKIEHVSQALSLSTRNILHDSSSKNSFPSHASNMLASSPRGELPNYAYDLLLEQTYQNALLIDNKRNLMHIFGQAKRFLSVDSGRMSTDIVHMILPQLKPLLSTALHRVNIDKKELDYVGLEIKVAEEVLAICMVVKPIFDQKSQVIFVLIQFKEHKVSHKKKNVYIRKAHEASDQMLSELERELASTKESLQATIEEVGTTNEELQSTNEELLASNEELQSTNEELHSVNEELYTVNAEHQKKIEELTTSKNDIDNFIRSTDIGTIFIDAKLNIKRYTPAITNVFDLLPQDVGRSLKNFAYNLRFEGLLTKIKATIKSKKTFTKEVQTQEGQWFFMRIQPYLVEGQLCQGAVISFFNIQNLKQAHQDLINKESRYRALIEAASAVVWDADYAGIFEDKAQAWCSYTGQKPGEAIKLGWIQAVHEEARDICKALWQASIKHAKPFHLDTKVWSCKHDCYHYVRLEAVPLSEHSREGVQWVCSLTDIDVAKRYDEKFRFAVQASPFSALIADEQGIITFVNASTLALLGYEEKDLIGQAIEILLPKESRERHARFREHYMKHPEARIMASGIEVFVLSQSGKKIAVEIHLSPIEADDGLYILCSMMDISKRIKTEEILQRSTEELELRVFERTHALVEANASLTESEKRYAMLYEHAPDMYASVSPTDTKIIQCNETLVKVLGYKSKSEVVGRSVMELYSASSIAAAKHCFERFVKDAEVNNTELTLQKRDGSILPVMLKVNAVRDEKGRVLYSISSWRDISAQKALEQEKRMTLELDMIYQSTKIMSEVYDSDEAMQACLKMICEVIDWPVGHVYLPDEQGKYLISSDVWALKHPRKFKLFKASENNSNCHKGVDLPGRIWSSKQSAWIVDIAQDTNFPRSKIYQDLDVKSAVGFPVMAYGKVIAIFEFFAFDVHVENHELLKLFQVVGEQVGRVLERKQVEAQIEALAHYDVVTGLPNRIYFNEVFQRFLSKAKRTKKTLALFYLDVDNFKKINDTLGHPVGDKLLSNLAIAMKELIRDEDFIARLGGDEFVILMDEIKNYKETVTFAKRILACVSKPSYIDGHEINISMSIGIALYPDGGKNADTLHKNADMAMYRAKAMGKNAFHFYSEELNDIYQRQITIESHLRHAIKRNELSLVYQPQVAIKTGKIYGFEALIRWENETLGHVTPMEFIPVAEDAGLIHEIGAWVLETACQQFYDWGEQYLGGVENNPLVLSINLSVLQLMQKNTVEHIKQLIKHYQFKPNSLMLELTETALMSNLDHSTTALDELSALGVGLAIDDFGTGYSSLSYLKQLSFTSLKIDQSFVRDVMNDANDASIVQAIIQMGSVMDLEIIAEGVETKEQLDFLKSTGCDYAQGYYFSRPQIPKDIEETLRNLIR